MELQLKNKKIRFKFYDFTIFYIFLMYGKGNILKKIKLT